jgi:hypothetical protein
MITMAFKRVLAIVPHALRSARVALRAGAPRAVGVGVGVGAGVGATLANKSRYLGFDVCASPAPANPWETPPMVNVPGSEILMTLMCKYNAWPGPLRATVAAPTVDEVLPFNQNEKLHFSEIEIMHGRVLHHWNNAGKKDGFRLEVSGDQLVLKSKIDGVPNELVATREMLACTLGNASKDVVVVVSQDVWDYLSSHNNIVTRYLLSYTVMTDIALARYEY